MSVELTHEQIQDLLGAFAMDAVEGDEAEAIELHLRDCPRCRAEVAEHREVAALLAHTGAPAPEGVWAQILSELEPAPPPLRMPEVPPGAGEAPVDATVADLGARRASSRTRMLLAALSAAAVLVAVLGVIALNQSHRLDRMEASLRDVSVDRVAARAMADREATNGDLVSTNGQLNAPVVVNAKGMGYLLAAKLPKLPADRTYQLWARVDGATLSLGAFDGGIDVVQFQVNARQRAQLHLLMVTEEKAPGVTVTQQQPLLTGSV